MPSTAPRIEIEGLTRVHGSRAMVEGVSLSVAAGEVMCLLGPSGCGKSTTLRMIAGAERPDTDAIRVDGRTICDAGHEMPPEARAIGLVFQNFALFPHLSVGATSSSGSRVGERTSRAGLDNHLRDGIRDAAPVGLKEEDTAVLLVTYRSQEGRYSAISN